MNDANYVYHIWSHVSTLHYMLLTTKVSTDDIRNDAIGPNALRSGCGSSFPAPCTLPVLTV